MTDFLERLGNDLADAADRLDGPRSRRHAGVALATVAALALLAVLVVARGGDDPRGREEIAVQPTPTPVREKQYDLVPIGPVLERIRAHVDVPVTLPPGLPAGTRAFRTADLRNTSGVPSGNLTLRLPGKRAIGSVLSISYGRGSFDGCGPTEPRTVSINGEPGVLTTSDSSGTRYSTVVWPTSDPAKDGTYNVSGPFTPAEILALARSMNLTGAAERESQGC